MGSENTERSFELRDEIKLQCEGDIGLEVKGDEDSILFDDPVGHYFYAEKSKGRLLVGVSGAEVILEPAHVRLLKKWLEK